VLRRGLRNLGQECCPVSAGSARGMLPGVCSLCERDVGMACGRDCCTAATTNPTHGCQGERGSVNLNMACIEASASPNYVSETAVSAFPVATATQTRPPHQNRRQRLCRRCQPRHCEGADYMPLPKAFWDRPVLHANRTHIGQAPSMLYPSARSETRRAERPYKIMRSLAPCINSC